MDRFFSDPLADLARSALASLEEGVYSAEEIETEQLDLKEEAGRRDQFGNIVASQPHNEVAAKGLADEAACMANTPGGGVLIVGVADNTGELIGTDLEIPWLRKRIYDLTQHKVTPVIRDVSINGVRLLVVIVAETMAPVEWQHRYKWRVGTSCVDMTLDAWHQSRRGRENYDWSSLDSGVPLDRVRDAAIEAARDILIESNESAAQELAQASNPDFLRRLGVVTENNTLTNAGALLFTARATPALDYIRRPTPSADSQARVNLSNRSLLEELREVMRTIHAYNPTVHTTGLAAGQLEELPTSAVREAIVNGLAHRNWDTDQPTVVDHIGSNLTVTSPGGFVGAITPQNIITHPSTPRYPELTALFARLRIAERQGIGVDRMMRDMLRIGKPRPEIAEIDGPYVRASLVGGAPDLGWLDFLVHISPARPSDDLDILAIFTAIDRTGWTDNAKMQPLLQRNLVETESAFQRAAECSLNGNPVIRQLPGTPAGSTPVWLFSDEAATALDEMRNRYHIVRPEHSREQCAVEYAAHRGRISSTELAGLTRSSNPHRVLRKLEEDGILEASRSQRSGPGFYYRYLAE